MMKISTKVVVAGAASLLGVAMVAGGAYAATGSLTAADAPGRVLQVSGLGPAAAAANATATAHANTNARGLFGANAAHPSAQDLAHAMTPVRTHVMMHVSVSQVARPAPQMLPANHAVMHSSAPQGSAGMSGSTGMMR
jgi:hypothetical protein